MSTWVVGMQERIAGCEAQLQQLDEQVVSLKGEFESKKGLEIELKNSLAKAEATLTAASALLGKLSGEKSRWEAQVSLGSKTIYSLVIIMRFTRLNISCRECSMVTIKTLDQCNVQIYC